MKDFRFTGKIEGHIIDVTFRTDAIGSTDSNFTVMQIQVGDNYSPNDSKDATYQKYLGTIKALPNSVQAFKAFATANGLDLTESNSDGSGKVYLVDNASVSNSDFN